MSLLWPSLAALLWAVLVAGIGGALTDLGPWYRSLKRPALQPPDWLFGPAWTLIFALAAAAAVLAWSEAEDNGDRTVIIGVYIVNGVLNVLWNLLYFTLRRPDWALAEVAVLWLSILAMIVLLGPISGLAGLLLVPYLLWVGFASYLNYDVVRLNGPFGRAA
jgi:tryptophan-rich sensory protein